ncbi:MAG: ATP phosphoribosyltransferase regulatory subunit, partial [Lachnospiraceae bacterium]|nr:ATP phosphoribosyltransferase regulatory subunit [Lachnospiraceae bacterium]
MKIEKLLHTPDGVRDVYGDESALYRELEDRLRKVFLSYGYSDIRTPSFEYFDVFSEERGSVPSRDLYKFFDHDGNTLVLRPDITPAIARCAA